MSETYTTMITPKMAAKWLEKNTRNRRLNSTNLRKLIRVINGGQWLNDGNPIRFSIDGTILDGQHRLQAIVSTGVACESDVREGLPKKAQESIDTGKPRSPGDHLHIHGVKNANRVAAFVRQCLMWEGPGIASNASFANQEVYEWLDANLDEVEFMFSLDRPGHKTTGLPQASVYDLLFWITSRIDADAAVEFFTSLAKGANLDELSPILALKKCLQRHEIAANGAGRGVAVSLTLQAWNFWRQGKPRKVLNPKAGIPTPV